jgi:hypothetical protein
MTEIFQIDSITEVYETQETIEVFEITGNVYEITGNFSMNVQEVPTGAVNGVNVDYTLSSSMIPESIQVMRNGLLVHKSQVTVTSSTTFTLSEAPLTGDLLEVNYIQTS